MSKIKDKDFIFQKEPTWRYLVIGETTGRGDQVCHGRYWGKVSCSFVVRTNNMYRTRVR